MSEENDSSLLKFRKIPGAVREFLLSDEVAKRRLAILDKYQLDEDQWFDLTGLLNAVHVKDLPLSRLVQAIVEIGISPENAKAIALELAGYEFLPASDYLGGVDDFIRSLGGNPANYPPMRITVRAITPTSLVTEFLHEHPVNVPAFLDHRLREILESRVREVRKDAETVTRLTRAEKIGGVELPHEEAETLVAALAAKISAVQIAPDAAPQSQPAEETTANNQFPSNEPTTNNQQPTTSIPIAEKAGTAPTLPSAKQTEEKISRFGHGVTAADEREADTIRERVLPKVISSELFDQDREIREGAAAICAATTPPVPAGIFERYRNIVASRLKGVRDQAETEDLLLREPSKGGMGFGKEMAQKVLREIEKQASAINSKRELAMKNEKDAYVRQAVDYNFSKDESRKRGEQEDLDRLYSSLTGRVSKTPMPVVPPPPAQAPTKPAATLGAGSFQEPKSAPVVPLVNNQQPITKNPIPLPPPPPPVAEVANTQQPKLKENPTANSRQPLPKEDQGRVVSINSQTPHVAYKPQAAPLAYQPSSSALQPATNNPQPKMQDVRPVAPIARLTGPAEELKNMTIADFRRLSTDPVEACRKIMDKLDLLEEHAYAQRIGGIQAWQQSETNKLYLQVIMAAFSSGKPIADVIAENQAAKRETLTEREVHAIMELNRSLKA